MNSSSHLSAESEFRYIITWFRDFSEYEKQDFHEILVKWLLNKNEASQVVNGFTENGSKPTIFHCRVKLFKEWSSRWPDQLRSKLIDKLNELDSDFGQKVNESLEAQLDLENAEETNNVENNVPIMNGDAANGENGLDKVLDEEALQNNMTSLTVNEE